MHLTAADTVRASSLLVVQMALSTQRRYEVGRVMLWGTWWELEGREQGRMQSYFIEHVQENLTNR